MESELKYKQISKHPVVKHINANSQECFYAFNLRIDNFAKVWKCIRLIKCKKIEKQNDNCCHEIIKEEIT